MRLYLCPIAPLLVILMFGCNTVDADECWPNTSGGFGGGGTIPIGAGVGTTSSGDFISPPPWEPLDSSEAPNPCIVAESPCIEKCLADYESAAIVCGKIEDEAQRKSCQDKAYVVYKSCRETCSLSSSDCLEHCKEQCDKENIECIKNCPKGDKNCMNECNQQLGRCYKECERKCK